MQCEICGKSEGNMYSDKNKFGITLCKKHYEQLSRNGYLSDYSQDTQRNKSEINMNEDVAEIVLKDNKYNVVGIAKIDVDKLDIVENKRWCMNKDGYVITRINGTVCFLHHLIMNVSSKNNMVIDHIDNNKLNNTLSNLRVIDKQKNHMNHNGYKNNKSGFTGVIQDKRNGRWKAIIRINKKPKQIGVFKDIKDAVRARLTAELKYYGKDFAPQRHLFEEYEIKEY